MVELVFVVLVFVEGGQLENQEKNSRTRQELTTISTHILHRAGIERGPH